MKQFDFLGFLNLYSGTGTRLLVPVPVCWYRARGACVICCVMSCKLYNIRKFAMLIEIYFTIAKFAILRGIYFTIATFAKVRSQKQYSQLRYSQFNRVTVYILYKLRPVCMPNSCKCEGHGRTSKNELMAHKEKERKH